MCPYVSSFQGCPFTDGFHCTHKTKDPVFYFLQSRPVHEVESGPVGRVPPPSLPPPSPATTTATSAAASHHKTQEGLWVDKDKRSTSRHGRGKDKK
jgi:hypothetical protein